MKTIFAFLVLSDFTMTIDMTRMYGIQTIKQCNFIRNALMKEYKAKSALCYKDGDIYTRFQGV